MPDIQDLRNKPQAQYLPLSTTIDDYDQALAANAIVSDDKTVSDTGGGNDFFFTSVNVRLAQKFISAAAELGNIIDGISFWLKKENSPTGTVTCGVWDSSNTLVHTFGTLDIATLTTSYVKHTFNTGSHQIAADDRVGIEYTGSSGTTRLVMDNDTTGSYDSTASHRSLYDGTSWTDNTSADCRMEILFAESTVTTLTDGNTVGGWTSNSEINPFFEIDMSGTAEIGGIALYYGASDTTTKITIAFSTDGDTWVTFRTIDTSLFTSGQYNYVLVQRQADLYRYIRIRGEDATAKVMHYHEVDVRTETESFINKRHKHKDISTVNAGLALDGGTS